LTKLGKARNHFLVAHHLKLRKSATKKRYRKKEAKERKKERKKVERKEKIIKIIK
jgi:hypothetical protein